MKIVGEFNSVWDLDAKGRGYVITTDCTIDLKTGEVVAEAVSADESASVTMLDREFVEVDGREFAVKDGSLVNIQELKNFVAQDIFDAIKRNLDFVARDIFDGIKQNLDDEFMANI